MKRYILLIILTFIDLPVVAAEETYSVSKGEWLFIPVVLPEAEIGGGDFYNLRVELDPNNNGNEYSRVAGGIRVRSENPGPFNVAVGINHVTKSSCAGVEVTQYSDNSVQVHVVE